jgi:hypothetical protein
LPTLPKRGRTVACSLLSLAVIGCRFDYHAPNGARVEDVALQGVATTFYASLTHHDTAAFARAVFPAATVLIDGGRNPVTLVPARTLLDVPGRRTDRGGVRLVRSELRSDGDLATARLVIAVEGNASQGEYEASDLMTLARREGSWRIAHVVLGPWRLRSAP